MRTTLGAVLLVLAATTVTWAQPPAGNMLNDKMLLGRADYQLSTDSAFKDVYDLGPVYGAELLIPLAPMQHKLAVYVEGSYLSRSGKLTYTAESTDLTISTAEAGLLYRFGNGPVMPYLGAGLGAFMFNEKSDVLGEASQTKIGFSGVAGVSMGLGRHFVVDGRVKYNTSSMNPAGVDITVGGLSAGLGLGVRF
jgi:opacity protein-like surface antigen